MKALRVLAPVLLVVVPICLFWPSGPALIVTDASGKRVYSREMELGERFSVVFIHSVAKSRVEEVFEITGDAEFRLRETLYADFGAGLPHEELPGLRMEFGEGRIRLSGYDVRFDELSIRVGYIAGHRLKFSAGEPVRLAELAKPGAELRLAVKRYRRRLPVRLD